MSASSARGHARTLLLAAVAGGLVAAVPMRGLAQDQSTDALPTHVALLLMVSHVTVEPGPVDPAALSIHRRLHDEFQFQSFRVLERHSMDLRLQEAGGVVLPTGKRVELRPIAVSPSGVLIAVDIPGTLQTDVRVANRKQVVIGVERYLDGKLLLTLEPNY
jgi:hypothetical protein